jgi:hypothetical protein
MQKDRLDISAKFPSKKIDFFMNHPLLFKEIFKSNTSDKDGMALREQWVVAKDRANGRFCEEDIFEDQFSDVQAFYSTVLEEPETQKNDKNFSSYGTTFETQDGSEFVSLDIKESGLEKFKGSAIDLSFLDGMVIETQGQIDFVRSLMREACYLEDSKKEGFLKEDNFECLMNFIKVLADCSPNDFGSSDISSNYDLISTYIENFKLIPKYLRQITDMIFKPSCSEKLCEGEGLTRLCSSLFGRIGAEKQSSKDFESDMSIVLDVLRNISKTRGSCHRVMQASALIRESLNNREKCLCFCNDRKETMFSIVCDAFSSDPAYRGGQEDKNINSTSKDQQEDQSISSTSEDQSINSASKDKDINSAGEDKSINSAGEDKNISSTGDDQSISSTGEDKNISSMDEKQMESIDSLRSLLPDNLKFLEQYRDQDHNTVLHMLAKIGSTYMDVCDACDHKLLATLAKARNLVSKTSFEVLAECFVDPDKQCARLLEEMSSVMKEVCKGHKNSSAKKNRARSRADLALMALLRTPVTQGVDQGVDYDDSPPLKKNDILSDDVKAFVKANFGHCEVVGKICDEVRPQKLEPIWSKLNDSYCDKRKKCASSQWTIYVNDCVKGVCKNEPLRYLEMMPNDQLSRCDSSGHSLLYVVLESISSVSNASSNEDVQNLLMDVCDYCKDMLNTDYREEDLLLMALKIGNPEIVNIILSKVYGTDISILGDRCLNAKHQLSSGKKEKCKKEIQSSSSRDALIMSFIKNGYIDEFVGLGFSEKVLVSVFQNEFMKLTETIGKNEPSDDNLKKFQTIVNCSLGVSDPELQITVLGKLIDCGQPEMLKIFIGSQNFGKLIVDEPNATVAFLTKKAFDSVNSLESNRCNLEVLQIVEGFVHKNKLSRIMKAHMQSYYTFCSNNKKFNLNAVELRQLTNELKKLGVDFSQKSFSLPEVGQSSKLNFVSFSDKKTVNSAPISTRFVDRATTFPPSFIFRSPKKTYYNFDLDRFLDFDNNKEKFDLTSNVDDNIDVNQYNLGARNRSALAFSSFSRGSGYRSDSNADSETDSNFSDLGMTTDNMSGSGVSDTEFENLSDNNNRGINDTDPSSEEG